MKFALTHFLLYLVLAVNVFARGTSASVTNNAVQFIENKGQITDQHGTERRDIDAKIEANGVVLFVGGGELHYQWTKSRESEVVSRESGPRPAVGTSASGPTPTSTRTDVEIYRMDVKLHGANKNAEVIFEEPTGYYEHYYTARTGENGVRARGFQRVIYKDIYPNIDLVLYTEANSKVKSQNPKENNLQSNIEYPRLTAGQASSNIKYDFIVHPGGNPADIQLRYEGATEVKLVDGALMATTPFGTITEAAPYSYAKESGERVASAYQLAGNQLTFDIGSYTGTLVIDPALLWATYYGGTLGIYESSLNIATDIYENVYLCGGTWSNNNIATTGAFQSSRADSIDAYVVKFDSSGTRLWATYYGNASGSEIFTSIACDKWGNVYLGGVCDSFSKGTGLTTSGAHQSSFGGYLEDAMLVKFNAGGQRQWATLYGGNGWDFYATVACDDEGNVYLGGGTSSTNTIATNGTNRTTTSFSAYGYDGFIAQFNGGGTRLWGTYYGGNNHDCVLALKSDHSGNIYAGGTTLSSSGIASTGAHQGTFGGQWDGLLARFNSANGTMVWSTYYGGNSLDEIHNIDIHNNEVYTSGFSYSANNIASNGVYGSSLFGYCDAFIAVFNSAGARQWGSYYGGSTWDLGFGMAISPAAKIYIGGMTASTSGISTTGAQQTSYAGGQYDGFIAEFTSTGQLGYGSYYGGTDNERYGYGAVGLGDFGPSRFIAVSNAGRVYMAGMTTSSSGIATTNAHQTSKGGNTGRYDAFLTGWDADTVVYIPQRYTDTLWCPGDTVRIVYGTNKNFGGSNNFTVQLSDDTGSFDSPVAIGTLSATDDDTITCVIPMNTPAGTGYRIRITGSHPVRTSWDNQWDIRVKALPANLNAASNSPVCAGDTLHLTGISTNTGITWVWTGPNSFSSNAKDTFIANSQLIDSGKYILKATLNSTGCSLTDTTTVEMRPTPDKPTAGSNSPVCETLPLTLTTGSSTSGVSYSWVGPGSYSSSTQNPTVTTNAGSSHAGDYISTVTLNGCSSKDTTTVVVLLKPAKPTAAATNSPLCQRQDLQLTASTVTGASYTWYGPSAFTANTQNPVRANVQMADAGTYYVYATVNGCISDTDSVAVVVNTDPFVNIFPTPGATICAGQQTIFTAIPTNGGTSPSYSWLVNGMPTGSTGTTYSTTTLNNGDAVSCAMTSTGTCATPFIDTSNAITMTVQPILSPTVTMTADKMPPWNGGLIVTFTATPTHGGANPEYQWKRNGQDITGATGSSWGVVVNALNANEDICVVLKSSYECAVPDTAMSNCITSAFTGVGDVVNNKNIKIYPNPTSGNVTISSNEGIEKVEIINLLGQKLLTRSNNGVTIRVDMSGLVGGVYIIKVNDSYISRVVKE